MSTASTWGVRALVTRRLSWMILTLALLLTLLTGCSSSVGSSTPSELGPLPTVAVPVSARDLERTIQAVIRTVQPSIVEIQSSGSAGQSLASGEVISTSGYIVTNDHVVHGNQVFAITLSTGQTVSAALAGEAPSDDLAILKVAMPDLRPIPFGDSDAVEVGTLALAIGSPYGLSQSATFGIVSALNRTASELPGGPAPSLSGLIQTSAPINPGNSGGALVNLHGELIGIPTLLAVDPRSGELASGIGFAIPSNHVKAVTDKLMAVASIPSVAE